MALEVIHLAMKLHISDLSTTGTQTLKRARSQYPSAHTTSRPLPLLKAGRRSMSLVVRSAVLTADGKLCKVA